MRKRRMMTIAILRRLRVGRTRSTPRQLANALVVALFVVGLAVPMIGSFTTRSGTLRAENRQPAPVPKLNREFTKQFDAYYADRTGARKPLLKLRNQLLLNGFHESPARNVLIGVDGWLYLNTGFDPLDTDATEDYALAEAAATLSRREQWCKAHSILYVVQVTREKHFVHPEHLPRHLRLRHFVDPVPALAALIPNVTILDPRPALQALARSEPVYYQKDSHWNTRGMLAGYRQLAEHLERIVPGYRGKPLNLFTPDPTWKAQSDLAQSLGWLAPAKDAGEDIIWHQRPAESLTQLPTAELDAAANSNRLSHIQTQDLRSTANNNLHAMLLHDSFGITFRDDLAGDFHRFTALGTYSFPTSWLEQQRPTVVIQQFVDRSLLKSRFTIKD
jgi:hypothetical protein